MIQGQVGEFATSYTPKPCLAYFRPGVRGYAVSDEAFLPLFRFNLPPPHDQYAKFHYHRVIIGSVNGLILLWDGFDDNEHNLFMVNPMTSEYLSFLTCMHVGPSLGLEPIILANTSLPSHSRRRFFPPEPRRRRWSLVKIATPAARLASDAVRIFEQSLILLIKSCKTSKQLQQIQSQILINATDHSNHIVTSHFLAKCVDLRQKNRARQVFDRLPDRSHTSLWNVMSKGYLQNDAFNECLELFRDMMRENVNPNCYTLPVVLKSCCKSLGWKEGEEVHCVAVKNGFISNTYVGTNLIEFYSGAGCVACAYRAFTEMVDRNVVSWTAMIAGYVANHDLVSARRLFDLAPERDVVLWNRMFTVHIELGDMVEAKRLFDMMPCKDLMAYNTLLNGYAKNGDVERCERLFESMREKNHFSWNGLIGAYAQNGQFLEVLDAFKRMVKEANVQPNDATLVHVLAACAKLGDLDFGKMVHRLAEEYGYEGNVYVCNGLIDMYAKCGLVECAICVFEGVVEKDLITWNTVINALAVHGHGGEALRVFRKMRGCGEKPDAITFIGILSACSHMGFVRDGLAYFHSMTDEYAIQPKIEHYGCVVDLLARGGHLTEAVEFIKSMPVEPDSVMWTALLAASRIHKKIEFAELSLERLIELDPHNPANYVMLSNVYGEAGKWEARARVKVAMRDTGSKKVPGWSSIRTEDGGVAEFYCFDEKHSRSEEIYLTLRGLTELLRLFGYKFEEIMELHLES
ncbi:pentatricopeptide repeat-containing protein At3g29230-like [Salvia splendens]|nr:pentatricopeptide repeat-containing protein At3g29230-like [Salvia splendens]